MTKPGTTKARVARRVRSPFSWLANPRNIVFFVLIAVLGLGGGRRWLQAIKARRAIALMDDPDVSPEQVEAL
jgi:hypothetical protein